MAETTWIETDDGRLHCTQCDSSFARGRACNCRLVGESAALARVTLAGTDAADSPTPAPPLPNALDYERQLVAVAEAQRRLRDAILNAQRDNVPVESDDGRVRYIRAWESDHSILRLRLMALESERKTLLTLHAMAVTRELPDLVEKYEAIMKSLGRRGRGRRSHSLGDSIQ